MNDITYAVSVDVNNPIIPYNVYVASVLDSNVRYLEITLYQNGNVIALSNTATATASLVTDNVLVNDSVDCTISNNIITVPLEDLQRHGNLDVQVTVTEDTKVLAIPFPIQVMVTPNIAENAQISEASQGTIPELLARVNEELARVSDYADDGRVYEMLDCTLSGDATSSPVLLLDNDNQAGDYILYYVDSEETRHELFNFSQYFYTKARVDAKLANKADTSDLTSGLAQKANANHTHSQYLTAHQDISGKADKLSRGADNELVDAAGNGTMKRSGYSVTTNKNAIADVDSANRLVPNARTVAKAINDAKALIPTVPTNVSAFTNDSGYLTAHQDISGKADTSAVPGIVDGMFSDPNEEFNGITVELIAGEGQGDPSHYWLVYYDSQGDRHKLYDLSAIMPDISGKLDKLETSSGSGWFVRAEANGTITRTNVMLGENKSFIESGNRQRLPTAYAVKQYVEAYVAQALSNGGSGS